MLESMLRALRKLAQVYYSWRLLLAVLAVVSLVGLAWGLGRDRAWLAALLALFGVSALLALHGLDVARQDRLRARAKVVAVPTTGTPTAIREEPEPRPRPVRPAVTIVVTTHNEGHLLMLCLQSVLDQTWDDFECIVVDDLSTNDTLYNAFEWFGSDERFRFVHSERNLGLAGSRNIGLALAQGTWITFLDADDFLYPDAIASRVAAISTAADQSGFVAGSYGNWHSVPEDATPGEEPPSTAARDRVTWLDAVFDTPFIASAPLISTAALRKVGKFDEALPTAEDFEFWSRFLRHGYVLVPTNTTGVAYRQRRRSMYRRTSEAHAAITTGVYEFNQRALDERVIQPGTPFVFTEPAPFYQQRLATARRLITGIVVALAQGDDATRFRLTDDLANIWEPWMRWALSDDLIVRTALRVEAFDPEGAESRAGVLAASAETALESIIGSPSPLTRRDIDSPVPDSQPAWIRELKRSVPVFGFDSFAGKRPVLLMPSAAYHCDEIGPLAGELERAGVPWSFVVIPKRLQVIQFESTKYTDLIHVVDPESDEVERVISGASAIVTLNDWGDYKPFVLVAKEAGVPSFGKVEGVQDFEDVDVHWERKPYSWVDHILCQGENDFKATQGQRTIVGTTRLERIWLSPPTERDMDLVIINLNFTYGVLTHARDLWLSTAIAACRKAGLRYVISAHPAEEAKIDDVHVADVPIRHLLTYGGILISRFSTVPFEAMARGVPFVYHNPHGEKVATFKDPGNAFRVTGTIEELTDALREARGWDDYRRRCEPFLRAQVDVVPDHSSESRTADVVIEALR